MKTTPQFIAIFILVFFTACSPFASEEQFTKKLEAPAFVSELYGSSRQTLSISHPEGGHISWMGFVQSNDYDYFKITRVQAGDEVVISDGKEINGVTYVANSNVIVEDITIDAGSASDSEFVDGSITLGGDSDLKITVDYSPLIAADDEDEPHEAYLVVNYDKPRLGSLRLKLEGITQGVKEEKCTQAVTTMDVIEYKVKGSAFDLYFCSAQVAVNNQDNTPQDAGDPDYHGASTNIASVPLTDDVITFYQVDAETVCLLYEPTPSIPSFILPIPAGLAPIDSMNISMVEGSFAECALDADGNILCPDNVLIDALVSLTGFSLSSTGFTAEELVSDDCPDFGAISGSGAFGDSSLTLILTGKTLSDQNTEEFDIVDSLIVAVIGLEK